MAYSDKRKSGDTRKNNLSKEKDRSNYKAGRNQKTDSIMDNKKQNIRRNSNTNINPNNHTRKKTIRNVHKKK